jgi:hypothetical protein
MANLAINQLPATVQPVSGGDLIDVVQTNAATGAQITVQTPIATIITQCVAACLAAVESAAILTNLPPVTTMANTDSVAVSVGGQDHLITLANFLGGETIDQAQAAAPAADTDTFFVGQGTSSMYAQTFAAMWTYIAGKMPIYKFPVVEITANTLLDGSAHNGRILVCSQPVTLTHSGTQGSGFSCLVINASSGNVTFDSTIATTSGVSTISAGQIADVYVVTYSAGTKFYAWVSGPVASPYPGQVIGVSVGTVTYTSVAISWSAPVSGGTPTGYIVQYRITGQSTWTALAASVTNAVISGLAASTEYDIEVIAANAGGNGTPSSIVNATTAAIPTQVPGQVTGLSATGPSASTVNLAWSAPISGGAVGSYTAQYRVTGQSSWITAATGVSATNYTVTGLTASTAYDFSVFAVNAAGNGTPSSVANATTTVAAPGTPTALTAGTMTQTTAPVSWTAPSSGGAVTTYTLQYRVTGAGSWTQITGLTVTSTTITGLTAGTQYDLQVAAVNAGGTSAFTATTNATTVVANPGLPTALTLGTATSTTQPLSWTAPASGGAVATYSVRYSVHAANSWTTVSGISGTSTTITGLTGSTSYDYEVESVNAGGNSGWTAASTGSTAAPSNYLLTQTNFGNAGQTPAVGYSAAHGTNGIVAQVNDNSSSSDGSKTAAYAVNFAFSTSNSVQPTSGMQAAVQYSTGGHNLWVQYVNGPTTAGTWYLWALEYDSSGTIQSTTVTTALTFT